MLSLGRELHTHSVCFWLNLRLRQVAAHVSSWLFFMGFLHLAGFSALSVSRPSSSTGLVAQALQNGLARLPPMGYNSWNDVGCDVDETIVLERARYLKESGLAALGYEYVNLDDCWQADARDQDTQKLVADPHRFPNGIRAVADQIHALGLKFGIYTDRGTETCAGRPGSHQYEAVDARQFAIDWAVDFVKIDNCYAEQTQTAELDGFQAFRDALLKNQRREHPVLYSVCGGGWQHPFVSDLRFYAMPPFGAPLANMWRISADVTDVLSLLDALRRFRDLQAYGSPGGWNDLDMLIASSPNPAHRSVQAKLIYMDPAVSRTQFSLYCVIGAPLLLGAPLDSRPSPKELADHRELETNEEDFYGGRARTINQEQGGQVDREATPAFGPDLSSELFFLHSSKNVSSRSPTEWDLTTYRNGLLISVNQQARRQGGIVSYGFLDLTHVAAREIVLTASDLVQHSSIGLGRLLGAADHLDRECGGPLRCSPKKGFTEKFLKENVRSRDAPELYHERRDQVRDQSSGPVGSQRRAIYSSHSAIAMIFTNFKPAAADVSCDAACWAKMSLSAFQHGTELVGVDAWAEHTGALTASNFEQVSKQSVTNVEAADDFHVQHAHREFVTPNENDEAVLPRHRTPETQTIFYRAIVGEKFTVRVPARGGSITIIFAKREQMVRQNKNSVLHFGKALW
ncbi:unnamed protein product [Amoebophrya sp. A120]|nr:unnamed protein product [Amoebophrya sp. A120]|eukprot:GSA120T00015266001.1